MRVPPSSGDCARGLDRSLPAAASGRSIIRWQHPEVIENTSRHESQGLIQSANGSRANRADGSMKAKPQADRSAPPNRACHSLVTQHAAPEPPVKAALRLACSLRSLRSALTGPDSGAEEILMRGNGRSGHEENTKTGISA